MQEKYDEPTERSRPNSVGNRRRHHHMVSQVQSGGTQGRRGKPTRNADEDLLGNFGALHHPVLGHIRESKSGRNQDDYLTPIQKDHISALLARFGRSCSGLQCDVATHVRSRADWKPRCARSDATLGRPSDRNPQEPWKQEDKTEGSRHAPWDDQRYRRLSEMKGHDNALHATVAYPRQSVSTDVGERNI